MQAGFKFIENESFDSTFGGLIFGGEESDFDKIRKIIDYVMKCFAYNNVEIY